MRCLFVSFSAPQGPSDPAGHEAISGASGSADVMNSEQR